MKILMINEDADSIMMIQNSQHSHAQENFQVYDD